MRVRHRHRLKKIVVWTMIVLVSSLAGGLWFAYAYVTDSATLARAVRAGAPRYLRGGVLEFTHARVRPLAGLVEIKDILLRQTIDGASFPTLQIPWLSLQLDTRNAMQGRIEPSAVEVAHPTLRLCQRSDGTWNLQGLLADPLPSLGVKTPPIHIKNGTVELWSTATTPGSASSMAMLRDVSLHIETDSSGKLAFDGTARGDSFDHLDLQGTFDLATGRLELSGDLAQLTVADPLRSKLPAEVRPAFEKLGLTSGECDLRLNSLVLDPAEPKARWHYDIAGHLRAGVLECKWLPFPIDHLTAQFSARDGDLAIDLAEGFNGSTSVRVDAARFRVGSDLARDPFALEMKVVDLELDDRLRRSTPAEFMPIWTDFQPRGRVTVTVSARRDAAGAPVRRKAVIDCDGVAIVYRFFKYPVDHVLGQIIYEGDRISLVDLHTSIGGQPLTATGTIDNPGGRSIVALTFTGQAMPVDRALLEALPPDVSKVVAEFHPRGTVRGAVSVRRSPPLRPSDDPAIGHVSIDAFLDLNEHCGITWVGMPYPIDNLVGRLEFHTGRLVSPPDVWEFQKMRGSNGQAVIEASGKVEKLPGAGDRLNVDLHLTAKMLPFDDQLRAALPEVWQKSWQYLDPTGSSDVDARIRLYGDAGKPPDYHLEITPRRATSVNLTYSQSPRPGADPKLRLDRVTGRFVFHNGPVDMTDVGFEFHGAPVQFETGRVVVADTGRFELGVWNLRVRHLQIDSHLRQIMPPVMNQFAQKLDDGHAFALRGNLGLRWSGKPGAPVQCGWDNVLVAFIDNSVQLQPGINLEHMQGQLDHVHGLADSESLDVHGVLRLKSVSLFGQQITDLESPLDVERGSARLDSIQGTLLGGQLSGAVSVSLAATPQYAASVKLRGADLHQYAMTMGGHQTMRGRLDAQLELAGRGTDVRALQGNGEAHVVDGDLGRLPGYLRLINVLQLYWDRKPRFDSADVVWKVVNGKTYFTHLKLTGNPFSLMGPGTMDVQGDLDLSLRLLYGRDTIRAGFVSDLIREASGQLYVVRVTGRPSFPQFKPEILPDLKITGERRRDEQRRQRD